jgi:hypothetical protein
LGQQLLGMLLRFPEMRQPETSLPAEAFSHPEHQEYFLRIREGKLDFPEKETLIFATEVLWPEISRTEAEQIFHELTRELLREYARAKLRQLSESIRIAEKEQNTTEKIKLMQEFAHVSRQLQEFES